MSMFRWIAAWFPDQNTTNGTIKITDNIEVSPSAPQLKLAQRRRDGDSQKMPGTEAEGYLANSASTSNETESFKLMLGKFDFHTPQSWEIDLQHLNRPQQLDQVELREVNETLSTRVEGCQSEKEEHAAKTISLERCSSAQHEGAQSKTQRLIVCIGDLRNENEIFRGPCKRLEKDFEGLFKRNADRESELDSIKLELAISQRQLQACKDDLFRLKPEAQLPDDIIVAEYEALCEQVASWVNGEIYKVMRTHPNATPGQIFSAGMYTEVQPLVYEDPDMGEYIVKCMVHVWLCETLLDREPFLQGLSDGIKDFLEGVERSMRERHPPKSKSQSLKDRSTS